MWIFLPVLASIACSLLGTVLGSLIYKDPCHFTSNFFCILLGMIIGGILGGLSVGFAQHRKLRDGIIGIIVGLTAAFVLGPYYSGGWDRAKIGYVIDNIKVVVRGIEMYAREHNGKFPISLSRSDFDWPEYITCKLEDPFVLDLTDEHIFEQFITTGNTNATAFSSSDNRLFKNVGTLRYYVSQDMSSYAITYSDKLRKAILWHP